MQIAELEKRLTEIDASIAEHNKQMQQIVANLNVLQGSKNECVFWLGELHKFKQVECIDSEAVVDLNIEDAA